MCWALVDNDIIGIVKYKDISNPENEKGFGAYVYLPNEKSQMFIITIDKFGNERRD